jgi:competence protein ComEC
MVKAGVPLSANVLKVGHHGSQYSTSDEFLDKVNPKYAVISVGKGNKYGHPTQEVLNRLSGKGIQIFRTDEQGTIVSTTDGNKITFNH